MVVGEGGVAVQGVVAGAAGQGIGAALALQEIVTGAAVEDVVAATTEQRVVAGQADQGVVAADAVERVVVGGAGQGVVGGAATKIVLEVLNRAVAEELDLLDAGQRIDAVVAVAAVDIGDGDRAGAPAADRIAFGDAAEYGDVELVVGEGGVAVQGVVAGAAGQGIGAALALQEIVTGAAVEDVVAATTEQRVVAGQADQGVVAADAVERVVVGGAGQGVVGGAATKIVLEVLNRAVAEELDLLDAGQRIDAVVAVAAVDIGDGDRAGAPAADRIALGDAAEYGDVELVVGESGVALEGVVAGAALQRIGAAFALQEIVAGAAVEDVVAGAAEQRVVAG